MFVSKLYFYLYFYYLIKVGTPINLLSFLIVIKINDCNIIFYFQGMSLNLTSSHEATSSLNSATEANSLR